MDFLSVAQMREADRRCIEELGIPGAVLMNTAGTAVFHEIQRGPVGIVCGKGNNGGDGYVVARLCRLAGWETHVVTLADRSVVTGDPAIFLHAYERLGGVVTFVPSEEAAAAAVEGLADCAVLVDAVFGTGISGEVRGPGAAAIRHWPAVHTIAVDVPSGIDGETGDVCGAAVKADVTITFHAAKKGFQAPGAQDYLGRLVVADIGIPAVCGDDVAWASLKAGWTE